MNTTYDCVFSITYIILYRGKQQQFKSEKHGTLPFIPQVGDRINLAGTTEGYFGISVHSRVWHMKRNCFEVILEPRVARTKKDIAFTHDLIATLLKEGFVTREILE